MLRIQSEPQGFKDVRDGALGDILLFNVGLEAGQVSHPRVHRDVGVFKGRQELGCLGLHLHRRRMDFHLVQHQQGIDGRKRALVEELERIERVIRVRRERKAGES